MRALILCCALLAPAPLLAQDNAAEERDVDFLTGLIEDNLSDAGRVVRVDGFNGALSSIATVTRLSIADDAGEWLVLEDVTLNWNRSALLGGRVEVTELSAALIQLLRAPTSDAVDVPRAEAVPFALPDLPVAINIESLRADRIEIGPTLLGEPMTATLEGRIALEGGEGSTVIRAERVDDKRGLFAIEGLYNNESGFLALDLDASEGQGGIAARMIGLPDQPALRLRIVGEGPLSDYDADIALGSDGVERVTGTVALRSVETGTSQVAVDLGGDVTRFFAPEYRPFFGDDVRLGLLGQQLPDGVLLLDDFTLRTRAVDLRGQGRLSAEGWPQDFALVGQIAEPNGGAVTLPVAGNPMSVQSVDLDVQFNAGRDEGWTGAFEIKGFDRLGIMIDRIALNGSGTITQGDGGAIGRVTAEAQYFASGIAMADVAMAQMIGPTVAGDIDVVTVEGEGTRIERLTLAASGLSAEGRALIGTVTQGEPINLDLTAQVAELARLSKLTGLELNGAADLKVVGDITPLDGGFDLKTTGTTRDLTLGIAQLDPLLAGRGVVVVDATRDTASTRIETLRVATSGITAQGTATLTSDGSTAQFDGRVSDTSLIDARLIGPLSVQGNVDVDAASAIDANITAQGPSGLDAVVSGRVGPSDQGQPTTASATLMVDNLGVFSGIAGRDIGGAARIETQITGTLEDRALRATVTGTTETLVIGSAEIDPILRGAGSILATIEHSASGAITIQDLIAVTPAVGVTAQARVAGDTAQSYDVDVTINAKDLRAFARMAGQNTSGAAVMDVTATGELRDLTTNADVDLRTTSVGIGVPQVDQLLRGAGRVTARIQRNASGRLLLSNLDAATPNLSLTSNARIVGADVSATYEARLRDIGVFTDEISGAVTASGTAATRNGTLIINATADGPQGNNAAVRGQVFEDGRLAMSATGAAPLAIANRAIEPRRISGTANFDIGVNGAAELGSVSGQITTTDARIAAPTLGNAIENLDATITLNSGRAQVAMDGTVAKGGRVNVGGPVALSAPYDANLTVTLQDLLLRDPALYETRANADLQLQGPITNGGVLAGLITLGQVDVQIPTSGFGGIGELPQITHVGASTALKTTQDRAGLGTVETDQGAGSAGRPLGLDLTISAPSRIFIRGRGLDAELGGQLRVGGTTDQVVPQGQFSLVRGRFTILGQRFDLTEGSATLEGDFNAFLRLVAETERDELTIGVILEGPAGAPEITFTSSPELPEDEVLAQLLFGRALDKISPLQAIQLAGAVSTLAGRGGGVAGTLRDSFGLDDFDVTTDEDGNAAVRAGAYISENVYTDVTVGSDGNTEINLNLDISSSLTAKGTLGSDGNTSLGLFFEKDY